MTTLVWFWSLTLPSWENESPPWLPRSYLFVPLICVILEWVCWLEALSCMVHKSTFNPVTIWPDCVEIRRGRVSQQWPLLEQLCRASLTEGQSVPAMCTAHRSLGQVRQRVQGHENKGISCMDSHCPQLKPSITPFPACSWMVQLPLFESFLSLSTPGALDSCPFKAISSWDF